MVNIKETFITIYKEHKPLLIMMLALFLSGLFFCIFSLFSLDFSKTVTNIGYGDLSGYRSGGWVNLLAFPILSLTWGILHNFIALRLFAKRGSGWAGVFIGITFLLILGAFLVLLRLTSGS